MRPFYAAALNDLYRAVVHASFRGYPDQLGDTQYTLEDVAGITYDRLISLPNPQPVPMVYTVVLGSFTPDQVREVNRALSRQALSGVESLVPHAANGQHYLVVRCAPSAYSLIAQAFAPLVLTNTPAILVLRLNLKLPRGFPSEIFSAVGPTTAVQLLNVHSTQEELLMYLAEKGLPVQELHYLATTAYLQFHTRDQAASCYREMLGVTLNGHHVFVSYYPAALAAIGLWC